MDKIIKNYLSEPFFELNFCKKEGIMYQNDMSQSVDYGIDYYEKYIKYESTEIAKKINKGRTAITEKYCDSILDIGIGSGEFIKSSQIKVFGFDINPFAIKWLKEKEIFINPFEKMPEVGGLSFWDSLEHMKNPNSILSLVKSGQYVFISIPIFKNLIKVKESKHYRPNEHYYYFTKKGMIKYMKDSNFSFVENQNFETKSGRENILTFVFKKN
jgi:hypothetical protein